MERQAGSMGKSRVHFNHSENEEADPVVNVASFEAESTEEDEGRSSLGGLGEEKVGQSKDITEAKPALSPFYFEESDSDEEDVQSPQDTENIQRFLKFKSPSAPTSPQSSPIPSPRVFPEHRSTDIPLLDLNRTPQTQHDSRPSSAGTYVDQGNKEKRQSTDSFSAGKNEADRLVREHTRRGLRPKEFFRRLSSGNGLRSGQITPEEDGFAKHHTFNSGVLTNLLKLYNEQPQPSGNTPPSGSGRTTPKWYAKSPNNSSTSLSALLASSTRAAAVPGFTATEAPASQHSHDRARNLSTAFKPFHHKSKLDEQMRLTANKIADVLQRQRFLLYCFFEHFTD